ncbi:oligosaccharide flippase family protein [Microbacterium sp. zg.Y909]|uniref:oligosaccharide flippase family protein n=1 Tax=Microbacterium sp. zg.Y909 TaxID=2969413 RepID=UPI00214C5F5A|nr:oligosaccharide flippase family protein [Microbacterium sp. zg.Y909]MCR2823920.1 oligosaccharide flippase family protein [Microbacterium sp. zg.Y909]
MADATQVGSLAARGAVWSGLGSITLRLSGLAVGIILARILTPEQFGVYAIALTVQAILITVADLGLSADLIRSEDPDRIAPTVASLGLFSGSVLTVAALLASGGLAEVLGSPQAAPAIAVLSFTLVLGGATVVPYAMLQRRFQQRELFLIAGVDFIVSTTITLALVFAGFGVLGLAIGRVAAQVVSAVLQFLLAKVKPRFAIDRSVIRPVLAFGVPIAAANLLSWTVLNADNIILARAAGVTALGYYVLAFNISSWPMSALSQMVRSIALPYFARAGRDSNALDTVTALAWALALPAGGVLAVLSAPVIGIVYGEKWLPAAPVLAALGVYGSLRVVFDVFAGFLYARGRSRPVLWIQIVWLVVLVVAVYVAVSAWGIIGAAWAHVLVAVVVILPGYLLALRGSGVAVAPLLRAALWPTAAACPAIAAAYILSLLLPSPLGALLIGGSAAVAIYALCAGPWLCRIWRRTRTTAATG